MKVQDHPRVSEFNEEIVTDKNQFTTAFTALAAATLAQADLVERSGSKLTQSAAASRLSAGGVGWTSSGGCSDKNNPSCTSFDGVYSGTVDGAVTLKRACGCTVTITGGTETGHAGGTYRSVHSFMAARHPIRAGTVTEMCIYMFVGLATPMVTSSISQRIRGSTRTSRIRSRASRTAPTAILNGRLRRATSIV